MTLAPSRLEASQEDIDGITKATLNYVEGFTTGDAERHSLAYHPEALKRRYDDSDVNGIDILETISPQGMVDYARTGRSIVDDIGYEMIIDAVSEDIASVRLYSDKWVDFLHVVKARGQWRILHVTWHYR